jgi:hypothetical protein
MANAGIFDHDTLSPKLKMLNREIDAAVTAVFEYYATRAESAMRQGARWQDQTGNARAGLGVTAVHIPGVRHELVLFHGMPYGIWLEIRWSGKYAIIGPVMQATAVQMTSTLITAINRITR